MAKRRFCTFIINVSIVLIISASEVSAGEYKPKYKSNFTVDGVTYHVAFFEQNVNWDEADVTCKVHYGYLLSKLPTASTLYSKLKEMGVDYLWAGIRRRESYYIEDQMSYQVLYKEKKVESSRIIGEQWADGEDLSYDCVVLDLKNGVLITQNCSLLFPFVCESHQTLEANNEGCPNKWYLSPALSITGRKCISEARQALPYTAAEIVCATNGSRLATVKEYALLKVRKQLHSKKSNKEFWARNEDDRTDNSLTCTYQLFQDVNGTHEHPPCSKPLPFVCVKSVEPEISDSDVFIEVGSAVKSVDPFQIFAWNSTCKPKDMIICSIKNRHPNEDLYQWFIDNVPAQSPSYAFRLSFLAGFFKWTNKGSDSVTKQGSYYCEVRVPGSVRSYRSKKIDLFYPDVATYIIDINGIGRENYVDYSQSTFHGEMNKINRTINDILKMKNVAWDFKSMRKIGDSYSMKLAVFIRRSYDFDDNIAFMNVKRSFEENVSKFQLGKNITLTVHSADVCFQSDIKPNDACGEIRWPTTKQVKNVLTETACLNEHKKYVHRECKGSTLTKAKWSSFDCSVCKDFRKKFQDETIQCPHGYNKIKNQDICFKIYHDKKNWFDAHKTCSNFSSYLLDVPIDSEIESVNSLWLSFKYSHGQIQGFGQKPINLKTLYEKDKELIENIDMRNHELYCVSAVREKSGFKFKFENCNAKMPFVCVQRLHEIVNSDKYTSTSVKLYKQSNPAESCYYLEKDPYSWTEAIGFCEQTFYGAKLLNGFQDIDSYNYLKKLIIDQYSNELGCDASTWWMDFEDVIQRGMPSNLTYVDWGPSADFNVLDPHGVITLFPDKKVYWSLESSHKKLGLICKIQECHDNRPIQAYIERRPLFETNNTEDPLDWLKGFYFKCIPSGLYVADSISWYKDDIFWGKVSDGLFFPNNSILSDVTALESQGYYSCSADTIENKETVYSSKQLMRIPGFQTFVLSMKSDEEIYLIDCPKYILSNTLRENTELYKCFNEHWKKSINFNSYHFLLKSVVCHSTYIDIKVHVYFKTHDPEEEMLGMIQKTDFSNFSEVCKIDPKSVSAMSTAFCYGDEVNLGDVVLRWPSTEVGKSSFPDQICLTNEGTLIERKCMGDFNSGAFWSNISITKCREVDSPITKKLISVLRSEGNISFIPDVLNLTSNPELLQPSDVQVTVKFLRSLAEQEESFPSDNLPGIVRTVSNIIDVDQKVLSVVTNYSNRAVSYLEQIVSNIDEEVYERNISTKNVQVHVYPFNAGELEVPNGIYISNSISSSLFNASAEDLESNMKIFDTGVVIPNSLLHQKSNVSDRLAYIFLKNIYQQENVSVLSNVTSVSLHNVSVYDMGRKSITLLFKLNSMLDNNTQKDVRCVSWDDDLNTWSYKGCFLRNISQDSVICACNHLTSFTVIMIRSPPPAHETSLTYITYIGGSLSCIGLGLIMLTFLCFREWRKSLKNKCLFNFSLSHFLFLAVYMAAISQTDSAEWCKIIAIFLHYFLLSSFTWMVVLAYSVYLSLVKVFSTYTPCLIQKAMAFAWGLPAIIVIAVLSINHKNYAGDKLCWLSQDAFIYGIMIPLVLMLVINYIIFGTILYVNTCGTQYVACNQKRRKVLITRSKALLCTSVLLGLSWIFGFFAMGTVNKSRIFFMYLFAITTTFQGFLLAVFFILLPKATRQSWIKFLTSPAVNIKPHSSHINSSYVTNQVTRQV